MIKKIFYLMMISLHLFFILNSLKTPVWKKNRKMTERYGSGKCSQLSLVDFRISAILAYIPFEILYLTTGCIMIFMRNEYMSLLSIMQAAFTIVDMYESDMAFYDLEETGCVQTRILFVLKYFLNLILNTVYLLGFGYLIT